MSILRRYFKKGQIYFITCVTYKREGHLQGNYEILENVFTNVSSEFSVKLIAYVILPDHFHLLIDPNKIEVPTIIKKIKLKYSYQYRQKYNLFKKTLWQHRYWDHIIRDEKDLNRHIDYIHYNPVKHDVTGKPFCWKYSSIHNYTDIYSDDWAVKEEIDLRINYGE